MLTVPLYGWHHLPVTGQLADSAGVAVLSYMFDLHSVCQKFEIQKKVALTVQLATKESARTVGMW